MVQLLLGANALMIVAYFMRSGTMPPQIPLFYSQLWGESQLADSWLIIILPIFLNLLVILNQYIVNRFYSDNNFIKKIFYYLNIFLALCFTFLFIKIVFLVS